MQFEVSLSSAQNWGNGGNGSITVTNKGAPITNWQFQLTTIGFTIQSFWQLTMTGTGNSINVQPSTWKNNLATGEVLTSGFSYTSTAPISNLQSSSSTSGVKIIQSGSPTPVPVPTPSPLSKNIFAYYSEWDIYGRNYPPQLIPVNKVTHIMYAFLMPNPNQSDFSKLLSGYTSAMGFVPNITWDAVTPQSALTYFDPYASIQQVNNGIAGGSIGYLKYIKTQNPNIKILMSIGGWTLSWILSLIAANKNGYSRTTFAQSCASYLVQNGFDGVDIDWEDVGKQGIGYNYFDAVNDGPNLVLLAQALRQALDLASPSKHLLLSCAMNCDPIVIKNYKGSDKYFDFMNLMTYDFYGPWGNGGHHSGLYPNPTQTGAIKGFSTDEAVKNALSAGLPANKLSIGCPFYGRGWRKLNPVNGGPIIFGNVDPAVSPVAADSYSKIQGNAAGDSSWKDLKQQIGSKLVEVWDDVSQSPYCYSAQTGETWSYENVKSATSKAKYVINNNLAGIICWSLSDDSRDGTGILLNTIYDAFSTSTPTPVPTPVPIPTPVPLPTPVPVPTPTPKLTVTLTNNNTTNFVLNANNSLTSNGASPIQISNIGTSSIVLLPSQSLTVNF